MKYLGQFMAILTAFLFIVIVPCAVWTFATGGMLIDADTYKDALAKQNIYADLIPAMLPAFAELEDTGELDDTPEALTLLNIVRNLDRQDWQRIANELIPADWLQEQVETNLDGFFNWVNDKAPVPELRFDARSLRERLSGAPGQRAVNLIMDSWPSCTDEQLQVLLNFNEESPDFPFCKPPGEYVAVTSDALSDVLRAEASQLPDVVPDPNWLADNQTRMELTQFKQFIRMAEAFVIELWLIPVALLSLVVFFTVRSLKAFTRWTGWAILLGGIAALLPIPLLVSPFLLPNALTAAVAPDHIGGPSALRTGGSEAQTYLGTIMQGISSSIIGELVIPVLIISALLIGLGFLLLVISVLARDPEDSGANTYTPTPTPVALTPTGHLSATGQMLYTLEQTPPPSTVPPEGTPPPDPGSGSAASR